jgi:hypothetical protein
MKKGFVVVVDNDIANGISWLTIDQDNLLRSLQKLVDGNIEVISLTSFNALVVDEEGKLAGKPLNKPATKLLHAFRPDMQHDYIAGTALIVRLIPEDIAAYNQLNYVRYSVIPDLKKIIGG